MKKTTKIITLILFLTLLLATFIVIASAESEMHGVHRVYIQNSQGLLYLTESQDSSSGTVLHTNVNQPQIGVRTGGWGRIEISVYRKSDSYHYLTNYQVDNSGINDKTYVWKPSNALPDGEYQIWIGCYNGKHWNRQQWFDFVIDTVAPAGQLTYYNNVSYRPVSGDSLNVKTGMVYYTWSEAGATATLNGEAYTSGTHISGADNQDISYSIVLKDRAGNTTTRNFRIDKLAPTGTLAGVTAGGTTKGSVSFTWSEAGATATLNGSAYASGTTISGVAGAVTPYTIVLQDSLGNSRSYSFTIDKLAPTGTLAGVTAGGTTGSNVSFTWSESNCVAKVFGGVYNDTPYTAGYAITGIQNAVTLYVIRLFDSCGNYTDYAFNIDKLAPEGTLTGVTAGGTTGGSVSFAWSEAGATATLNGSAYASGTTISGTANAVTTHTIVLKDIYNNSRSYTFTINKKEPILNLYDSNTTLRTDGFITNKDVYFRWNNSTEAGTCTVKYKKNNGEWIENYLQDYWYHSNLLAGTAITKYSTSAEARTAITSYENSLVLSKTNYNPSDEYKVYSADLSYGGVGASYWEYRGVIFFREESLEAVKESNINSFCKSSNKNLITEEGTYTVQITSQYGISVTKTFTIDKTAPTGTLTTTQEGGFAYAQDNTYRTNGTVTFAWTEATVSATLNNEAKTSSFSISGVENENTEYIITLTDVAGNTTQYTVLINKALPTGALTSKGKTLESGGITNGNVKFTYNASLYTATLNNSSFYEVADKDGNVFAFTSYEKALKFATLLEEGLVVKGTWSSPTWDTGIAMDEEDSSNAVNGEYFVYKKSGSPNEQVAYFTAERLAEVIAEYAEVSVSVKSYYTSGTEISEEGSYQIILADATGNKNVYTFTIDKTAPVGELVGVANGGTTGGSVSFSWSEAEASATLNGNTYIVGASIVGIDNTVTNYEIILTDRAGNSTIYSFYIDKKAPTGKLTGVKDGDITNGIVMFSWQEEGCTATLNGESYTSGTEISAEGSYELKLFDKAGNCATYTFEIDKTAPVGELVGVANGGATKQEVTFVWRDDTYSVYMNGVELIGNLQPDGSLSYTFIPEEEATLKIKLRIEDTAGNYSDYAFTLDTVAPTGSLNGSFNSENKTKKDVSFSWNERSEGVCSATLNGNSYENGTNIYTEGVYTIVLTDLAGNSKAYTFEIDKTAPVGELVGVTNGGSTNGIVKFKWTEAELSATLNGSAYTKNSEISTENSYTLVLTDDVGNSTTYIFTIDKTAPSGTLSTTQSGGFRETAYTVMITNGNVSFTWSEAGATATLNGEAYTSGTEISAEGSYELKLFDKAGNCATYTFEIDKTTPVGELVGVANGGATNTGVSFSWKDNYYVATLNDASYIKNTTISSEGSYELKLFDEAGNSNIYSFTIDRTAPTGTLTGVANGGVTKNTVSFEWKEANASATLNGNNYISNASISAEGVYTLILTDLAGNSTTYNFEIDKSSASMTFSQSYNNVNDTLYFKNSFYASWTEAGATATLNGEAYTSGTEISAEGSYELIITDLAGNESIYALVLDKTAYTQNKEYFLSHGKDNPAKWYQTYYYVLNNNSYISGGYYSFSNEEDTLLYATKREEGIVEKHSAYTGNTIICDWAGRAVDGYDVLTNAQMIGNTYSIYFDINDKNKLIAYFDEANLNDAINHYAKESVAEKYIPSSPAPAFPGDDNVAPQNISRNVIYIKGTSLSWNYKPSNVTLYVDGYESSYTTALALGYHTIREIDAAGNVCEYIIVIDNQAPAVMCTDAAGNILSDLNSQFSNLSTVYASQVFSIIPNDNFDTMPLLVITLNGVDINVIDDKYTFSSSGTYTIKIYDIAGNKAEYTLYVSLEAPTITEEDIVSSKGTFLGKKVIISENLNFNEILTLAISKYDTASLSWVTLNQDSNGTLISADNLQYYIAESGLFKIVLTDNFGRTVEKQIEIFKDAPVGKVFTADGFEIVSGTHTQKNVYFIWEDSSCTAYLVNGSSETEYTKKAIITTEGFYTIKLVDLSNVVSVYTFYIDRTAPTGTILKSEGSNSFSEIKSGSYSNKPIKVLWDAASEAGTTATFSKNGAEYLPYTNGSLISEDGSYIIKLTDAAGNSRSYSFEIDRTVVSVSIVDANGNVLQNGAITNKNVSFVWSESGCIAKLGGNSYSSKTPITASGIYSFYIEDKYGNYAYYTVTIDKDAPTGTLAGIENGGFTNNKVNFTWSEAGATATLNGESYTSGTEISAEGSYELKLFDKAGNCATYTFEIDKTAPVGELVGVTNGGTTSSSVYLTWKEIGATATLEGADYAKKTYLSADNTYCIILRDRAGNETEYSFVIDTEAPEGELVGTENKGFTNSNVIFVWHENNCTATLNGEAYTSGTEISAEGSYELKLFDKAANSTTYTFTIDKTAPMGSFSSVGYQYGAMHVFNTAISFTWSESNLNAKLDGDDYTKRTSINTPGIYRLELSDRANNTTVYVFEIDFEKPVGELIGDYVYINGTYYFKEAFSFVWSENNCTATLDGNDYESGDLITDEGTYIIILKDGVGNFTEVKAILDKTAPVAEFSTSYNTINGVLYFNRNFFVNWSSSDVSALLNDSSYVKKTYVSEEKSYSLILSDLAGNTTTYSIVLDKTAPSALFSKVPVDNFGTLYFKEKVQLSWNESGCTATLNGNTIAYNSIIAIDDVYSLELEDKAGNTTTYSIVLDTVAPVGELVGVVNGGLSNSYVSFKWSENGCTATLNGEPYKKGTNIYNPDTYSIILYDVAGNSTEYSFIIDFEVPVGELIGVENGGITNKEVFFTWDKEELTATLNGEPYSKGSVISAEGLHTITLTSEAGNTTTYTFEIDKTAPVGTLSGVENGGITKSSVIFKWSEAGATATLNGAAFDKNTYIDKDNKYTLILTDRAGNYTEYTFEVDKTAPVGTLGGVENGGITNGKVSLTWAEANCTATLNSEEYLNGTSVEAEGVYELKLYDAAGNSTVYTFEIDRTAPVGELVGVENGGTTKGSVYFNWAEAACTATLNGESYTRKTYLNADDIYTLVLTDRAGNSSEYSFIIDSEAPTGFLSGVENGGNTNTDVIFTWSESGCTATLNGEEYLNSTIITDEKSYTIILSDICGNTSVYTFTIDKTAPVGELVGVVNGGITNGKVKLEFNSSYTALLNNTTYRSSSEVSEEGVYELKLYDAAGNSTVYTFEIDKTAPEGTFSEEGRLISGTKYFPLDIYFIWDEMRCSATLNGEDYFFATPISEDGVYELCISDEAGNSTTYNFIIDLTPPEGELVGVTNGGFTNNKVNFTWSEAGATATLNGNTYKKDTLISDEGTHYIILTDTYGNNYYYNFTIDSSNPVFYEGTNTITELILKAGSNFSVTVVDNNLKYFSFNGTEYEETITLNSEDLTDGNYEIIAEDWAGNISILPIIVKKTLPEIKFSDKYVSNENGVFFTKNTSLSWEEVGCTATLNGEKYKKNSLIYSDGSYVFALTDVAGNTNSFEFSILTTITTAPLSVQTEEATLEKITIEKGNNHTALTPVIVNLVSNSTVYVNGEKLNENLLLSAPGVYTVKTINAAGVEVEYTVTIPEPVIEDDSNSKNGADIALIVVGCCAGAAFVFMLAKGIFKKKKIKIKRI